MIWTPISARNITVSGILKCKRLTNLFGPSGTFREFLINDRGSIDDYLDSPHVFDARRIPALLAQNGCGFVPSVDGDLERRIVVKSRDEAGEERRLCQAILVGEALGAEFADRDGRVEREKENVPILEAHGGCRPQSLSILNAKASASVQGEGKR